MFTKEERLFIWKKVERFMGGLVVLVQKRRR